MRNILSLIAEAFDPKVDREAITPRPLLFAQKAVEYFFKIIGFFLAACLSIGLILVSCSDNIFVHLLPLLIFTALMFYLAITTFAVPLFIIVRKISRNWLRRTVGWVVIFLTLGLTVISVDQSPMLDLLGRYVQRIFPEHAQCSENIINFSPDEENLQELPDS